MKKFIAFCHSVYAHLATLQKCSPYTLRCMLIQYKTLKRLRTVLTKALIEDYVQDRRIYKGIKELLK